MTTVVSPSVESIPGLATYLEERFGREARSATVEPLGDVTGAIKAGGYARAGLVRWHGREGERWLVVESVRPGEFGHEDRADRAAIVLRAFDDGGSIPTHARPVDVIASRADGTVVSLGDSGEFHLVSTFAAGRPYAEDFDRISLAGRTGERDEERAWALADYLVALHRDAAIHPSWWRRRLRDLGGSGECVAGIADSWPETDDLVTDGLLFDIESKMLDWRYRLRHRGERLRAIHGDFHPWNILFRDRTEFTLLDRSRGALGEPADDVAALAINYLFFALRTTGEFVGPFAELFHLFWDRYVGESGDRDLREVAGPFFAFRALVLAHPGWYPNERPSTRRALVRFLLAALDAPLFDPAAIPRWLAKEGT